MLIRSGRDSGVVCAEGQPCKEAVKGGPSASQGERPQEKPSLLTP